MSVQVPDELAGPLLRYLVRHLVRDARDGGAVVLPGLAGYLRDLAEVDRAGTVADDGQECEESGSLKSVTAMVTVSQMAERSGFSCRSLRRWAASGRLRARRAGRTWLIDPESITEDR